MAGIGRVASPPCRRRGHTGRVVRRNRTRQRRGVKVQRFLWRKPDGTNQHAFQTQVVAPVLLPRLPTPLLPCTRTRQGQKGSRY